MTLMTLFEQMIWFKLSVLLLLGLCVGSFLNVVIYRLPLMLEVKWRYQASEILGLPLPTNSASISLAFPSSHCPLCKNSIPWWTNIPLLGFVILRGKCIACKAKISLRYPLIEVVTGLAFLMVGYCFNNIFVIFAFCVFVSVLIALMAIDLDTYLLPDELTLPLIWLGLLVNLNNWYDVDIYASVIGAVVGYLSLWSIYWCFKLITGKEGMGYGDFKLLAAIGAWFGWECLISVLLISSLLGIVYAVILKVIGKLEQNKLIPFGPFLGAGGLLSILVVSGHIQLL